MPNQFYHHAKSARYSEINEMYTSISLRAVATGLVGLFIPIYLYSIGYGVAEISIFFIISILVRQCVEIPNAILISRIGPKHMLAISNVVTALFMGCMYFIDVKPGLFFLAAALGGISESLFWLGYHLDLSIIKNNDQVSRQMSSMLILTKISSALGPLIGGIIATRYGIGYGFLLAIIMLIGSVIPLFLTKEVVHMPAFRLRDIQRLTTLKDELAYLGMNVQDQIASFAWPLFIFLFLGSYESTGEVVSLALVAGIVVARIIGELGDEGKNNQILKLGSIITAAVHVMRSFVSSFGSALFLNIANDLSYMMINSPFMTMYYQHSDHQKRLNYFLNMQIMGNIGKFILWLIVLVAAAFVGDREAIIVGFVAAAFGSLMMPLMSGLKYRTVLSLGLIATRND